MLFNSLFYYNDASVQWQVGFQDPATPIMEGIIELHNIIFFYLVIIFTVVAYIIFKCLYLYSYSANEFNKSNLNLKIISLIQYKFLNSVKFNHQHLLEIIWTLIPCIFLILIGVPSFTLLYAMDEVINPTITLKVLGHQWYWSYEYSDYFNLLNENSICLDSYMLDSDDIALDNYDY